MTSQPPDCDVTRPQLWTGDPLWPPHPPHGCPGRVGGGGGTGGQRRAWQCHRHGHGAAERALLAPAPGPPAADGVRLGPFQGAGGARWRGDVACGGGGGCLQPRSPPSPPPLHPSALMSPNRGGGDRWPSPKCTEWCQASAGGGGGHRGHRRGGSGVVPGTKAKGQIQGGGSPCPGGGPRGPWGSRPARCCHGGGQLSLPAPGHGGGPPASGTRGPSPPPQGAAGPPIPGDIGVALGTPIPGSSIPIPTP